LFKESLRGEAIPALALLAMAACTSSTNDVATPSDIATVAVSPSTSSVSIGGHLSLGAVVQDAAGHTLSGADIFWSVQDASIATISDDGVVTGVAPGTTQVSANAAGKSGLGTITVARPADPVPAAAVTVASVIISPAHPAAIGKNNELTLTVTLKDASGKDIAPGRVVAWTTSAPSVAAISPKAGTYSATVRGNKEGTATITATSEGKSASVTITVKH
jgi:lactocepin